MKYLKNLKFIKIYLAFKQIEKILTIIRLFSVVLLNFVAYSYIFTKFFRIICFSKLACRSLPMLNPYVWPYAFFNTIVDPYFKFWQRIFPPVRYKRFYFELHTIIGIEFLNIILMILIFFINKLEILIKTLENILL